MSQALFKQKAEKAELILRTLVEVLDDDVVSVDGVTPILAEHHQLMVSIMEGESALTAMQEQWCQDHLSSMQKLTEHCQEQLLQINKTFGSMKRANKVKLAYGQNRFPKD